MTEHLVLLRFAGEHGEYVLGTVGADDATTAAAKLLEERCTVRQLRRLREARVVEVGAMTSVDVARLKSEVGTL